MGRIRAFTLLEMLVVLGLVVLLIGLLVPTLNAVQSSSRRAREISGVRQLMVGYVGYATDNRGVLLPGYYDGLPIADEAGNDLSTLPGPVAARYPWRLAPYLSFELRGLYLDERVLEAMDDEAQKPYLVSLYPSFGLNTTFVGGDSSPEGYGYNQLFEDTFGKFYVTRLSEPKDPAGLLVFASSRARNDGLLAAVDIVEGYHRVQPPFLVNRQWETGPYRIDAEPGDFGHVSMRDFGVAIVSFCDGHTGTLDPGRIEDMSLWCDQATTPDWRLQAP